MSRGICFLKCINTKTNKVTEYYYVNGLKKNPQGVLDNSPNSKLTLDMVLDFEEELHTYIYNIDNYIAQTVKTLHDPRTKERAKHEARECLIWLADGMRDKLPEFEKKQQDFIDKHNYNSCIIGGLIFQIRDIIRLLYDNYSKDMEDAEIIPKSKEQLK